MPQDEDSRDKIIFATNSQTSIPKASLRATDSIHRQIELYFKPRDLFYDRRKNYYKNQGKKSTQIVSVSFLAQCLMSIVLQRPDFARARPSTLLTEDQSYSTLYNEHQDLATYYSAAYIGKAVETALKACGQYTTTNKSDIEFYVDYVVCVRLLKKTVISGRELADIDLAQITNTLILGCAKWVNAIYLNLGGTDKTAKGSALIAEIQSQLTTMSEPGQDIVI